MNTLVHLRCMTLQQFASRLYTGEEGQDMTEYGLLAGLISIVAVAMIVLVGPYLDTMFQDIANAVARM